MEIELGEKNGIVATVDTGAGVNVLPLNLYEETGLSGMKAMKALVQLADGSFARPLGIVEDVSMRVGGVEVKTNFVVMPASKYGLSDVVLLGRTLLNKLRMSIDMYRRTCTFEVDGKQHSLRAISPPSRIANSNTLGFFGLVFVHAFSQVKGQRSRARMGKASTQLGCM